MHSQPSHRFPICSSCRERGPRVAHVFAALAMLAVLTHVNAAFGEEAIAEQTPGIQSVCADVFALLHRGSATMWALAALLLLAAYVGITQLSFLTRRKHTPPDFEKDVVHLADTKGMDAGIALCKEKPSSLARVLQAALVRHGAPLGHLEAAVRNETALARYVLLRGTRRLGWLAAVAPILGLLGLVSNLTRHAELERALDSDAAWRNLLTGFGDGMCGVTFALLVSLTALGFYFMTRARASDLAHDIEVKAIDAVVTIDRKARQSIRLIEDIEEKIKTESMIKVPDLSAEFDEHPHAQESAIKTAVTTHAGGPVQP